jgi:hypothetical protein
MLIHPRIDGGIAFDRTVESQQFRSHRRPTFAFGSILSVTPARETKEIGPRRWPRKRRPPHRRWPRKRRPPHRRWPRKRRLPNRRGLQRIRPPQRTMNHE